jgi:hypothetical protein
MDNSTAMDELMVHSLARSLSFRSLVASIWAELMTTSPARTCPALKVDLGGGEGAQSSTDLAWRGRSEGNVRGFGQKGGQNRGMSAFLSPERSSEHGSTI